jgi:L-lactate utilization protein LutC
MEKIKIEKIEKNTGTEHWAKPVEKQHVERAMKALLTNGITAHYFENSEEARKKFYELLPKGAEVLTMSSQTLETLGIPKEILESQGYVSVRKKLLSMDRATQSKEMQQIGAAPDWVIGSVHAITEDGKVVIASNSGSQLPAYSYGSPHVIWIVGTQKIVKNMDEAMKRIYEYTLPLESERAKKAYGVLGSNVSKLLIFYREPNPGRITVLFVNEQLGF